MNISDTSSSIFNVVLTHGINVTSDCAPRMRFNTASGSVYSRRWSDNGGADGTAVNQTYQYWYAGSSIGNLFQIAYVIGIAGEEKLSMVHNVWGAAAGAGTAPARTEVVSKWAETSSSITSFNVDSGGTYWDTDSNISALGSDLTPVAAIPFPSDVQVGSRAEITDTRKMYHKADSYKVHTFLLADTGTDFTVTGSGDVEYLVIGGGGGGGQTGSGGGGAGGYRTATGHAVTAQSYNITVGAGGAGWASGTAGSNGSNSIFDTITSTGGGGGGNISSAGNTGGSGGGGGGRFGSAGGAASPAGQGYAGGSGESGGSETNTGGGGGGGAGGVGESKAGTGSERAGNGGVGLSSSISGSAVFRGGGGGGGTWANISGDPAGGTGGNGGGGHGGKHSGSCPGTQTAGTPNTGGGGGGAGGDCTTTMSGGSGIVIIKYSTSSGITATGGTITDIIGAWSEEGT